MHVGQILPYPPNIVNRNCIFLSKNVVVYTIFYTFFFFFSVEGKKKFYIHDLNLKILKLHFEIFVLGRKRRTGTDWSEGTKGM